MGTFSVWHWLIVLVIVLLLFGRDRIPKLAGDLAKGIKEFRSGMKEDDTRQAKTVGDEPRSIEGGASSTEDEATKDRTVNRA